MSPRLPDVYWPGWDKDEQIAAEYAKKLRERLMRRAGVDAMVRRWAEQHRIPQQITRGESESYMMTHAGSAITETLGSVLESLWQDAWVAGAGAAARLAVTAAGSDAMKKATASKASVNYRHTDSETKRCGTCSMFRDGRCTLVIGRIYPHDVCDEWDPAVKRKHEQALEVTKARSRNPFNDKGKRNAPLPPDPWARLRARLVGQGIPRPAAGVLASAYETWLQGDAASAMQGIMATLAAQIGPVLDQVQRHAISVEDAIAEIKAIIDSDAKATRIAVTEVTRASAQAAQQLYVITKVTAVRWMTARDAKVCALCRRNARAGAIPLGDQFPTGLVKPPQHPNCRCAIVPAPPVDEFEGVGDIMKQTEEVWAKSALTPMLSTVHHPLGTHGLWHTPSKAVPFFQQLPAYIQNIARALIRDGMDESKAIAMAVAAVKRWAEGDLEWGPHRKITPEVISASRRAVREWHDLRASHE